MQVFGKRFGQLVIHAIWFVIVTVFYFVPLGFHHMFRFGIIPFLFLDGESPQPGDLMWGDYGVHFFPLRLAVTILLWITSLIVIFRWLRYLDSKAYVS